MHPKLITREQFVAALAEAGKATPDSLGDYKGPILAVPVPEKGSDRHGHYKAFINAKYTTVVDPLGELTDIFIHDKLIGNLPAQEGKRDYATEYFQADCPALIDAVISSQMVATPMVAEVLRMQYKNATKNAAPDQPYFMR